MDKPKSLVETTAVVPTWKEWLIWIKKDEKGFRLTEKGSKVATALMVFLMPGLPVLSSRYVLLSVSEDDLNWYNDLPCSAETLPDLWKTNSKIHLCSVYNGLVFGASSAIIGKDLIRSKECLIWASLIPCVGYTVAVLAEKNILFDQRKPKLASFATAVAAGSAAALTSFTKKPLLKTALCAVAAVWTLKALSNFFAQNEDLKITKIES